MSLPALWVWLEGPHLEPFEALLDEFSALDVDLMLGPALVLQSGLGAIVALNAIGARCWLDLGTVVELESAQAMGRVLSRSSALGVLVSGRSEAAALDLLVRSAQGRRVLVRVDANCDEALLTGLHGLAIAGLTCETNELDELAARPSIRASAFPLVAFGSWSQPPRTEGATRPWIVRDLIRAEDPLALVVTLRNDVLSREGHNDA